MFPATSSSNTGGNSNGSSTGVSNGGAANNGLLVALLFRYPGMNATSATPYYYGEVVINASQSSTNITVYYNLTGLAPSSTGGMHIHSGTTCSNASLVGGHYWRHIDSHNHSAMNMTDPWTTMWVSNSAGHAVGSFTVETGYQYAGNLGHTLVIHDASGARIGCGILIPYSILSASVLATSAADSGIAIPLTSAINNYPGSGPGVQPIIGSVTVSASLPSEPITVSYVLSGAPANSSGGLHIHSGTSCSDASLVGGHYWNPAIGPDPWTTTWVSDASGHAIGNFSVLSGYGYEGNLGHTVVVHAPSPSGNRVGCGVLMAEVNLSVNVVYDTPSYSLSVCNVSHHWNRTVVSLNPGLDKGNAVVTSTTTVSPSIYLDPHADRQKNFSVLLVDMGQPGSAPQFLHWFVANIPAPDLMGGITATGNELAFYFAPANPDSIPRNYVFFIYEQSGYVDPIMYNVSTLSVRLGWNPYTFWSGRGRLAAVNFARVFSSAYSTYAFDVILNGAFGTIPCPSDQSAAVAAAATTSSIPLPMRATIGVYPGGSITGLAGTITVLASSSGYQSTITLKYNLTGLEASTTGGFHIHSGTSCTNASAVGGHYWTPSSMTDPWNSVTWRSDAGGSAQGRVTLSTGYGYEDNLGHSVVVHNSAGARIGCGVLSSTLTLAPAIFFQSSATNFTACNTSIRARPVLKTLFPPFPLQNPSMVARGGNRLSVVEVRDQFTLYFDGRVGKRYTIMMVDEILASTDTINPQLGPAYLHWLVVNVDGQEARTGVSGGDIIAPYFPPINPDSVPHDYVVYIYEQSDVINPERATSMYNNTNRAFFNQATFSETMRLGEPQGVTFAKVFTDLRSNYMFTRFQLGRLSCPMQILQESRTWAPQFLDIEPPQTTSMPAYVVFDTPASTFTVCNTTYRFARSVRSTNPTVYGGNSFTTVVTRSPPFIFFAGHPALYYTVMIVDVTAGFMHYLAVNIPGGATPTGVIGLGDTIVGYFPPSTPSPYPHSYVVRVYEQQGLLSTENSTAAFNASSFSLLRLANIYINATAAGNAGPQQIAQFVRALNLGPIVAYNWFNGFDSAFSTASFNVYGVGNLVGLTIPCPAATTSDIIGNATQLGFGMPPAASSIEFPLGLTYYDPAVTVTTMFTNLTVPGTRTNLYSGSPNLFTGTSNVLPPSLGRVEPLVVTSYADPSLNYTFAMVLSETMAAENGTLIWAITNVPGSAFATGTIRLVGNIVTPYTYAPLSSSSAGFVQSWIFPQSGLATMAPTSNRVFSYTLFTQNRTGWNLGPPIAYNFFTLSSRTTCLAADGVRASENGRCVVDCPAMLRMRRACTSCGTSTFTAYINGVSTVQDPSASIQSTISSELNLTSASMTVSVDGSRVTFVLPRTKLSQLRSLIQQTNGVEVRSLNISLVASMPVGIQFRVLSLTFSGDIAIIEGREAAFALQVKQGIVNRSQGAIVLTDIEDVALSAGSISAVVTFGPRVNAAMVDITQRAIRNTPLDVAVAGYTFSSTAATTGVVTSSAAPTSLPGSMSPTPAPTRQISGTSGSSSSSGPSGGAIAAIVIVVLLVIGIAGYALLIYYGKAERPGFLRRGPPPLTQNPYTGGGTTRAGPPDFHGKVAPGGPPVFHGSSSVVPNPTFSQA